MDLATRKVEVLGVRPQPNGPWMEQVARHLTGDDSLPAGRKCLIHDRGPLYPDRLDDILKAPGVDADARSPSIVGVLLTVFCLVICVSCRCYPFAPQHASDSSIPIRL